MTGSAALRRIGNGETRTIVLLRLVHPGTTEVDDLDRTNLPLDETFHCGPSLAGEGRVFRCLASTPGTRSRRIYTPTHNPIFGQDT